MNVKQAAKEIGIPYRTVAGWIEAGIIRPVGYVGRQRVPIPFTERDMSELRLLAHLRRSFSLQELRQALEFLRTLGHNPLSTGKFLVAQGPPGKRRLIKICANKREAIELLGETPGQLLLIPFIEEKFT